MENPAKYSFHDDYSEGAHPAVLAALCQTNMSQQSGYGDDEFCDEARRTIRALIGTDDAHIYFTPGGTGANLLSIASHLRPQEAIIAAEPGYIVGKEGGCVEATGHKILVVEPDDGGGKLTPARIQSAVDKSALFALQPRAKMVFISNATEVGTVYTRHELEAVAATCKKLNLLLLMDGARLGAAMASSGMTLADFFRLTDVFWIGGTKNGALLGEAVVIKDATVGADFPFHMKQRGMLLAKGRVLGIQFSTLLRDGLFVRLARHANDAAGEMSAALVDMGYELWNKTESNQVFVIFPPELVRELEKEFSFFVWERRDDGSQVVRLVTSWATVGAEVKRLCAFVGEWTDRARLVEKVT